MRKHHEHAVGMAEAIITGAVVAAPVVKVTVSRIWLALTSRKED